ncbi:MAG: hypothetical protein AB1640_04860 [bacterium]
MNANVLAEAVVAADATESEECASPILAEIGKKTQFFHFLQKEMRTSKTETEREAVLSILQKTKLQIRALEREWRQIKALSRSSLRDPSTLSALCTSPRIQ